MPNETSGGTNAPTTLSFKITGIIVMIVLNFLLFAFTTIKLFRKGKRNDQTNKAQGQNRKVIFSLISLALLCRGLYQGSKLVNYFKASQPSRDYNFLAILDNLPTILLITLASAFSNYWHKRYSSFEGYEVGHRKASKYRAFLILLNFAFYLVFALLMWMTLHSKKDKADWFMALIYGTFSLDLIIVTLALWITGKKLFNRTTRFISYTGRTIKSAKGFKCNLVLLIFCCSIKLAQQCIFFYSQLVYGRPFYLSDDITCYHIFVILFYIIGETGVFFCLIILLDERATKCEGLLEQENSGKLAATSSSDLSIYCSRSINNSGLVNPAASFL